MKTGDKWGAGTDANVFLSLFGDRGDTGERKLLKSQNRNKFERKQVYHHLNYCIFVKSLQIPNISLGLRFILDHFR